MPSSLPARRGSIEAALMRPWSRLPATVAKYLLLGCLGAGVVAGVQLFQDSSDSTTSLIATQSTR